MSELKRGDLAIQTIVKRGCRGLYLTCKTISEVEEFWRITSQGEISPIELFGRKWESSAPLNVYEIPEKMRGCTNLNSTTVYRVDRPGSDLVSTDNMTGLKTINMSFLRLVGLSTGGSNFIFPAVYSTDEITWIANQIHEAGNAIYNQYVRPITFSVEHYLEPK